MMLATLVEILCFPRKGCVGSLERVGLEALTDQWHGMASRKLTMFGKGGELKNWILEQPVNNKGCFKYPVSPKGVLLRI